VEPFEYLQTVQVKPTMFGGLKRCNILVRVISTLRVLGDFGVSSFLY
jgi:O-succinylbenzoate synthase